MTKRSKTTSSGLLQKGFTLIELLISIVITSIILVSVFNLFISNSLSYNLQQSVASVQEEGRYASQSLSQSFMLAGYSESNPSQAAIRLKNADGADLYSVIRTEPNAAGQKSNAEQYTEDGTGNNSRFDQVVLLINGGYNCAGNDIWPTLSTGSHWKYFYVNDEYQLICSDSAGNNEPVTSGIDAFQVQYGIDTNNQGEVGHLQPNAYVTLPSTLQRVVAVRFAIVVKSKDIVRAAQEYPDNYRMAVLDQTFNKGMRSDEINFGDGHLRRLFFSTVKLRNTRLNEF